MRSLDAESYRRHLTKFVKDAWDLVEPRPLRYNWHIGVVCEALEAVSRGECLRLILNVPPGTGKSLLTGVFWPAWEWARKPTSWFMYASYDARLPCRDTAKLVKLLRHPWYTSHFGNRIAPGNHGVVEITNLQLGGRYNTSFGGGATGRHVDIQVADDPIKPRNASGGFEITGTMLDDVADTWANTFASRMIDPETFRRVIVMQRVHENDLAGRELRGEEASEYTHVRLPLLFDPTDPDPRDPRTTEGEVLHEERFPPAAVKRLRRETTEPVFETQYQQNPGIKAGGIFDKKILEDCAISPDEVERIEGFRAQSWDFAFKGAEHSDHVAGQWWTLSWIHGEAHYFQSADPDFEPLTFTQTLARLRLRRKEWPSSIHYGEDKANGPAICDVLQSEFRGTWHMVEPAGSKIGRAHAVSPEVQQGRVHLIRGPTLARQLNTYARFPRVRRDDEVDAMTQYLRAVRHVSAFSEAMAKIRGDR